MADFKTVQIGSPLYSHVAGASTTIVNTGPGRLRSIIVGTPAGTCTVYDSTTGSGTVIAIITATSPVSLNFNCVFSVGLTVVTTSTSDVTIIYE